MYFFEWILTLFSKNLNPDIVSRIWDVSFLDDGQLTLYKAAIGTCRYFN